ncbi:MAG: hypothetical protein R3E79_62035 [Caldilineaceae bacterium]
MSRRGDLPPTPFVNLQQHCALLSNGPAGSTGVFRSRWKTGRYDRQSVAWSKAYHLAAELAAAQTKAHTCAAPLYAAVQRDHTVLATTLRRSALPAP